MGCNSSRSDKPSHEVALSEGDQSLLYSSHEISTLFASLKFIAPNPELDKSELAQYLKANLLANDEKALMFYKSLRIEKKYLSKILATLACLLSKGKVEEKVDVLIQNWGKSGKIEKKDFESMLDCIFELVLDNLPLLASPPTPNNNYTPDELTHFLERAKLGCEKSKSDITSALFTSSEVNKAQIESWYLNPENECWLHPPMIRENLKKIGKTLRKAKKTQTTSIYSVERSVEPEIETKGVVSVEVIEEHHHDHHHHEHHENRIDASE